MKTQNSKNNKIRNLRITEHCGAFAQHLYILGYPYSLIPFHSKRAVLWRFMSLASIKPIWVLCEVPDIYVKCPIFMWSARYLCEVLDIYVKCPIFMWSARYLCEVLDIYVKCPIFMWSARYLCEVLDIYVKCPIFMWSARNLCEVPDIYVKCPIFMWSARYLCKVPDIYVKCPIYMWSTRYLREVPDIYVECPIFMWSARNLCEVPDIFAQLQPNLDILDRFLQKSVKIHFMEIRPVGTALVHADRWTDTKMVIGVFCNYANAPKN
jgi:hypothetical protein